MELFHQNIYESDINNWVNVTTLETFLTMTNHNRMISSKYPFEFSPTYFCAVSFWFSLYLMYVRKKLVNGYLLVIYNVLENQLIVTCKVHLSFLEDSLPYYLSIPLGSIYCLHYSIRTILYYVCVNKGSLSWRLNLAWNSASIGI